MTRAPRPRPTRRTLSRALAATSASLFALTAVAALLAPPAQAAANGEWGPSGVVASDSPVTVRWDNAGNSPANTVSRASDAPLPHTASKTYGDTDPLPAQGLEGLQVTVSQTENLTNQTVQVSITGAAPTSTNTVGRAMSVLQCWGAPGADGTPDPQATAPAPETCEAIGGNRGSGYAAQITDQDKPLLLGGDWEELVLTAGLNAAPFVSIDGTLVPNRSSDNPYFDFTSTNDITRTPTDKGDPAFALAADGTGSRPFEVQTTLESAGLGCGRADGRPSTASCWLVVVPGTAPLSPSWWANRVQVRLGFTDVDARCAGGQQRTLLAGSELLSQAMASWIPALCGEQNTALGYTVLGDAQVRRELDRGTRDVGTLSVPGTADAFTSPVAVAGTVIAYAIDNTSNQNPVPQLKLNPRLVAKLLTQSYEIGIDRSNGTQLIAKAPWVPEWLQTGRGPSKYSAFFQDPEFKVLNPGLPALASTPVAGDAIAALTQSDSADELWRWVLSDPEARAFLHGCPDNNKFTINPFFSTRTYEECADKAKDLDAVAESRITATDSPDNFIYSPPTYPSDLAAYPQPGWYERDAVVDPTTGEAQVRPLTIADLHPRLNTLADVGRSVGRALYPSNGDWCPTKLDVACQPAPGKWRSNSVRQDYGNRFVIGVTDTVTAARFQLQTALLCATADTKGEQCVGADRASLTAAAARFVPKDEVLVPADTTDYGAGAYPLTLPIYAQVAKSDALTADKARTYASLFEWFAGDGQVTGYDIGQLPPGYAPMTGALIGIANRTVRALDAWAATRPTPAPSASAPPASGASPAAANPNPPAASRPATVPARPAVPGASAANAVAQNAAAAPAAVASPELVAKVGTTPPTESGFPQFALAGGLVGAILTGIASPLVGGPRRRRS